MAEPGRRQFDLLTLFEWVVLAGLFFTVVAGGGRNYTVWYQFKDMPEDDVALQRWYQNSDSRDVSIERNADGIKVRSRRPLIFLSDIPESPPWDALGYRGLSASGMEYAPISLRPHLAAIGVGVSLLLVLAAIRLRRRST